MTLDEFIAKQTDRTGLNGWIDVEGFSDLYVRKGGRCIGNVIYTNVFDVANVTATKPGGGAFTRLIEVLDRIWDGPIFIENVHNHEFGKALLRHGFTDCTDEGGYPCYARNLTKGKKVGLMP